LSLSHRLAAVDDLPALKRLMAAAIDELQTPFLSAAQIVASRSVMGLDTRLVSDGTYFLIEEDGVLGGCGGWSRRATLYGGDHSTSLRDDRLLDPATEPARLRAMYTHPDFVRRGIGRLVVSLCEAAARQAGFTRMELMGTLAGQPLYLRCGYEPLEQIMSAPVDGVSVPLVRMGKAL
jgi:GNAT superfamily N-acetyltransferase